MALTTTTVFILFPLLALSCQRLFFATTSVLACVVGDRHHAHLSLLKLETIIGTKHMEIKIAGKVSWRASLVGQWLSICLPMQGSQAQSLVWEDLTCCRATEPVRYNYCALQQGKPLHLSKRKLTQSNKDPTPLKIVLFKIFNVYTHKHTHTHTHTHIYIYILVLVS